MRRRPLAKVCGVTRRGDAEAAADAGADFLGAVLSPGFARSVTAAAAGATFRGLRSRRVGVFVDADLDAVLAAADEAGLDVVQLHGAESPELAEAIRFAGLEVWKAVRARSADDVTAAARAFGAVVDALLVDGYTPEAPGGAGVRFPWAEVAGALAALPPGPRLVAAGGLDPDNVADAARLLRPYAVDVSSGVERAPGIKDPGRIAAFVAAVRAVSYDLPTDP